MKFLVVVLILVSCQLCRAQELPANKKSSPQTIALYNNLKKLSVEGFLFGHQDDLAYGVNWRNEKGRSDVKEVCGDYPGIYGWDIAGIEHNDDKDINGIPFKSIRKYIREGYERGGVITLSWHAASPLDAPKHAWDTTYGTVRSILPGGQNHKKYKEWLDAVAVFIQSLKNKNGEAIPVLFRPFHELTGHWFWWCNNTCSPEEFITLWRFTVDYLNNQKNVNNILWVFNTSSNITTKEFFLERYPGDDVVDMVSLDGYQSDEYQPEKEFIKNMTVALGIMQEVANEKNKLSALAETGYEAIPDADWWTNVLMNVIGNNQLSFVLVWRNHGYQQENKKMHYYAPYKGQLSAEDFKKFYSDKRTMFEKDAALKKLYQIN